MLTHKLHDHFQQALGIEVSTHAPAEPDGRACIDKIGNFDDVLPLALRVSGYTGGVFEVKLHLLTRLFTFEGFGFAAMVLVNTAEGTQDLPDRRL